jgi:hypothetical protein
MLRTRDFSPRVLSELGPGCNLGHVDLLEKPTSTFQVIAEGPEDMQAISVLIQELDDHGYEMSGPLMSKGSRINITVSTPRGEEHVPAWMAAGVDGVIVDQS